MRKVLLPLVALFISMSVTFAQGFMDYVKEVRGDTVVVKDFSDMEFQPNSLNNVVSNDAAAPAGRVYELQVGGWYPQSAGFTTPSDRPVIIAGANNTPLVNRTSASTQPPIISGYSAEGTSNPGGITWE